MAPERIHYLRFILEGYDNLAMQSTVDVRQGLVELRYTPEVEEEVLSLLGSLSPALGVSGRFESISDNFAKQL
ncbi:MAG: DUF4911 domain-containing protein [Desulfobulbaceae bacterium]|nr:DUF4911 domain-containing protein [Desulfobulbaceae bacterium]